MAPWASEESTRTLLWKITFKYKEAGYGKKHKVVEDSLKDVENHFKMVLKTRIPSNLESVSISPCLFMFGGLNIGDSRKSRLGSETTLEKSRTGRSTIQLLLKLRMSMSTSMGGIILLSMPLM